MTKTVREVCDSLETYDLSYIAKQHAIEYDVALEDVNKGIIELKKWLAIAYFYSDDDLLLYGGVDGLWHTLILHTQIYSELCDDVFGHIVHHIPGDKETIKPFVPYSYYFTSDQMKQYGNTLSAYSDLAEQSIKAGATLFKSKNPDKDFWARFEKDGKVTCPSTSCCGGQMCLPPRSGWNKGRK